MINFPEIWQKVEDLPWCVLVSTGRSGSNAFQSQLDSHPEIFVFSGHLFLHTWWEQSQVAEYPGEIDPADLVDEFIWFHIQLIKTRYRRIKRKGELGPDQDQEIPLDINSFRANAIGLLKDREVTSRNLLIAVYTAYAFTLGQDITRKKVFFHHVHHVRKLATFLADFPDSKIICTTRDPRALYVSGVAHWRKYQPKADNPSYPLYILWRAVDEAKEIVRFGDRVRMLRLEDLDDPEVLKAVCRWLGVDFDPCVMSSTWAGLRWWGDGISQISGAKTSKAMTEEEFVKTIRTNNWEQKLSFLDKFVLRIILDPQLRHYSYVPDNKPGFWSYALAFPAIWLITGFEVRYWHPLNLWTAVRERRFKDFLRVFYHYLKRVRYFLHLYGRSVHGNYHPLVPFRSLPPSS